MKLVWLTEPSALAWPTISLDPSRTLVPPE